MSRMRIHIGHYGSGKTEISINTALRWAAQGRLVTLVDLDIVNPYFRSGEQRERLEAAGIQVIMPTFEGTTLDTPVLPAQVQSVFTDPERWVIFDVGGDPAGAAVLGRYKADFDRVRPDVYCIINACRPFTDTKEELSEMMEAIEARSRLKITALVNNANLARQTTPELLVQGQALVEQAAAERGLPIVMICGLAPVLGALPEDFRQAHRELLTPLILYMRPSWLDEGAI